MKFLSKGWSQEAGFDTKGSPGVRDSLFALDSKVLQVGSPADSLNLEEKIQYKKVHATRGIIGKDCFSYAFHR